MEIIPAHAIRELGISVDSYNTLHNGHQFIVSFLNGYGASIVSHQYSYGGSQGLWEIAILKDGEIDYSTPITSDVLGCLTKEEVLGVLKRISLL